MLTRRSPLLVIAEGSANKTASGAERQVRLSGLFSYGLKRLSAEPRPPASKVFRCLIAPHQPSPYLWQITQFGQIAYQKYGQANLVKLRLVGLGDCIFRGAFDAFICALDISVIARARGLPNTTDIARGTLAKRRLILACWLFGNGRASVYSTDWRDCVEEATLAGHPICLGVWSVTVAL